MHPESGKPQPPDRRPLPLPGWVESLAPADVATRVDADGVESRIRRGSDPPALLIGIRVPRARAVPPPRLEAAVHDAYLHLHRLAGEAGMPSMVRYWVFIPSIHHEPQPGLDLYRIFNAGRYKAFQETPGTVERWSGRVASSTGIGHDAPDLIVYGLAAPRGAGVRHLHNPRQLPPHAYSPRFGALPPCFARATLAELGEKFRRILISGTASIRGEESLHETLEAQTDETMANIEELIRVACETAEPAAGSWPDPDELLIDLQVYHRRPADAEPLRRQLRQRLPETVRLDLYRADVCRPELLVEIEGTARLPRARP